MSRVERQIPVTSLPIERKLSKMPKSLLLFPVALYTIMAKLVGV